ncbi:fungal-specific transcription factor domain-containing protein [Talaromyces proteolyticus]|uniref:Fungal-specific transcription factor domain-containing protein n=1 Tax=Talaromyces proteolyticus TaxID=1131652 RepID=A0AAD4KPR2_9EURO|nr:fungal-specific transcription factor domain-containing protein [Talaromyces proteolyticus]KAH8696594.1 fungal-specific transcription factor domain-containing protein [Talaromyces proteolyticus]
MYSFRGAPARVCDNCRRRKIRCNREHPCDKYGSSTLGLDAQPINNVIAGFSPTSMSSLNDCPSLAGYDASLLPSEIFTTEPAPRPPRISSTQLQAHLHVFLTYLYPIMPVVDKNAFLLDCANPEALDPRRYALLVALSAAAHLQLNLDMSQTSVSVDIPQLGQSLLDEALRTLQQFGLLDDPHVDNLLTMFFLFAAYGNLRKTHQAWHYLNQSICFAYMLKLNVESTYTALSQHEADMRRRIYWLLFITERAYALQTGRPVMLRGAIQKPVVFRSESPTMMYGFISLALLFEKISPEFYEWNIGDLGEPCDLSSLTTIFKSVAFASPLLEEVSETSRIDLVLTQQWLQTRLWRFYMDRKGFCQAQYNSDLPILLPVIAGKSVMVCLSSVAQKSTDAHGIGAEQKLYDIGECIFQLTQHLSRKTNKLWKVSAVDLRDVLYGILTTLSRIRGSQSYLLPALLQQSQGLLGFKDVPQPLSEVYSSSETDNEESI